VDALVGLPHPAVEVSLEVGERAEGAASDGVSLTYFTPDSVLPLVRARYGRQTRASTPKSRQKAAKAGCSRAVCVASSRPMTSAPSLSMSSVRGTPPKRWNAPAMPSLQSSWRALRNARTNSRREKPSTAQTKKTRTICPAMRTRRWPTSTCICSPGAVSNRTVAAWEARWLRRRSSTARCTVRTLASTPRSRSSRVTTTALPSASPS
jgi:hypothetical protein